MDFKIIWYGWDLTGSVKGRVVGSCEHSNERGFIKCTEFLDSLQKYQLLKDTGLCNKSIS